MDAIDRWRKRRGRATDLQGSEGFSLMEVAVAVTLLGVLAVSALLTIIPISRQTRVNRELEGAASAARNVLEQVHATPFNELATLYPDGTTIAVEGLESGEVAVSYPDPAADPLEMRLTLSWESPDLGEMSETFITMKTE